MNVVAIHGAFRGGWAFSALRAELVRRGHDLRAPSLGGMGENAPEPQRRGRITLEQWRRQVAALIELDDLTDVVLLGHSQGGMVARAAAPLVSERLRCVAYLDAPVPEPGQRGVDLAGEAPAQLPPADTWLEPTPLVADQHHTSTLVDWMNARLCANPLGPSLDPLGREELRVPSFSCFCEHTPETYPSAHHRRLLDTRGVAYQVLDAPHDAPLVDPVSVADWLDSVVESSG